jgi:GTP-binding protein
MFQSVRFIKSAVSYLEAPKEVSFEVAIVGRSNVGKSSLLNYLVNQKIAKVSKSPGKTRLLNYFLVDNSFYLVDTPGYGYASVSEKTTRCFEHLMGDYLSFSTALKGVILLLDSRREIREDDYVLLDFFKEKKLPFSICITKTDKVNQSERHALLMKVNELKMKYDSLEEIVFTSSLKRAGKDEVLKAILNLLKKK